MSITVHPQVLFNISTHIITNQVNNLTSQGTVYLGVLLGNYNQRVQTTDIVDSFELQYGQELLNEDDQLFLKERLELRLKGDQWNLFKSLDIVGWYTTASQPSTRDTTLHNQIAQIVQEMSQESYVNLFRYALFFHNNKERVYHLSGNTLVEIPHQLEPSTQEMITINAMHVNKKNKSTLSQGLANQIETVRQFEDVLQNILESMDHPSVASSPILLRQINEVLNGMPSQFTSSTLIEEFQKVPFSTNPKVTLLGQLCLLQSIQRKIQEIRQAQKAQGFN